MVKFAMRYILATLGVAVAGYAAAAGPTTVPAVLPAGETEAVAAQGDAADDPAIWRNPDDPAKSLVLATDKQTGLFVYDLSGKIVQSLEVGRLNNVDVRTVPAGIVAMASNRSDGSVTAFLIDPETGAVREAGRFPSEVSTEPYGFCLGTTPRADTLYAFVTDKAGPVIQFKIDVADGQVSGTRVRQIDIPSQTEGCVVDDRTGAVYIGEEAAGIWKAHIDPMTEDKELVAQVGRDGLVADVEGLAIAADGQTGGYLIASSQGDSTFAVYSLPEVTLKGRFRVGENVEAGIDEVSETDGIEVTTAPLGDRFPDGVFVTQDDVNTGAGTQNFKLVPWPAIKAVLP